MKRYIQCIIYFLCTHINAEQFIYPVADFDHGEQLIVLYQKSLEEIELWFLNPATQYALKGLSSFSIPANVRMLPSGKGFSFIDQGYIKIKEFTKRSARTLSIYEPIGLFSNMHWVDENNFYFVGRQGDFFQIFMSNLQAEVIQITSEKYDALYPQIIGSNLFFMQRNSENNFNFAIKSIDQLENNDTQIVLYGLEGQPCHLKMLDQEEGLYVQAPTTKDQIYHNCYKFICHHIIKKGTMWTTEPLFEFYIPSKYITGKSRLYESIEPFLPVGIILKKNLM